MHVYVREANKRNVDIVIYNLYYSPDPLLFVKFKPHHSEKLSDSVETVTFSNAHFLTMPTKLQDYLLRLVVVAQLQMHYPASGKLPHSVSWYRAFLCER